MPWTKNDYPDSMKKLPSGVRNKAIEIANAMLKENKKMNEGIIIATAIKHAKGVPLIPVKKSTAKKKAKVTAKKKSKSSAKGKSKVAAKNKIKIAAKKKTKVSAEKKIKSRGKKRAKSFESAEIKNFFSEEVNSEITETASPDPLTPAENLPSIPVQGGMHPVTPLEAHRDEKIIHHREEVSFHQENEKVKAAMASRKNSKRTYRMTGQR